MIGSWTAALAATLLTAGQPEEGDGPETPPPTASSLELSLLAGVWLPRLDGDASLGPGAAADLGSQFNLDDMAPSLNLELTIKKKDYWELVLSGFHFSTDYTGPFSGSTTFGGLSLSDGDPIRAEFDMTSVSTEVAMNVWKPYGKDKPADNVAADGHAVADLRIWPLVGMRYLDVDQTLVTLSDGSSVVTGGEWLAVYGGLGFTLDYRPEDGLPFLTMLRLQASVGLGPALGGDNGTMWQVRANVVLQVTERVGVMIGYRLMELDVENDDYALDGGLQGLFLAGTLRF